jgi:hypothetical protein
LAVTLSLSITQNSQNVANNTSNVTVQASVKWTYGSYNALGQCTGSITIDGTKYSFSGMSFNTGETTSGSQVVMTKTVNVSHNNDGTKTLSCSASFDTRVSSGTISASADKTLTTIPRKSTLNVSNGTLGVAPSMTVSRKSSSFTHTITYKCGTATGTICTNSSKTVISWTPPLSLAQQNRTGTSVSIVFTLYTYTSGGASVGSNTYTKTYTIPESVKPSVSLAVSDPTGHLSKYGKYVQGQSKLDIVATASGNQGSTIKSYRTTADGKTYMTNPVTTGVIAGTGTLTINVTVTDSRGRTASASTTVSVLAYEPPRVTELGVYRCKENAVADPSGAYLAVSYDASVTSLDSKNSAKYTLEYKKQTDDEYIKEELTALSGAYVIYGAKSVFEADPASSYNITLSVADDFTTTAKTAVGSPVKKVWSLLKKAGSIVGMAFGKIAELEDVFDIAFQTRFTGGILHPVIEPETDLNDIRTPNTYVGANVSNYHYTNCPLTDGTFTLEVVGMGEDGQVKQRLTYCHYTASRAWERIYYGESWGEWVCVSDFEGQLLWEGGRYMTADHTNNLAEPVSKQRSGIVLVFSEYIDGATSDTAFHTRFIPKTFVAKHPGKGHCFQLSSSNLDHFATKYLYISDEKIVGHANNSMTGTGDCGITFNNARFVLRYVIGV